MAQNSNEYDHVNNANFHEQLQDEIATDLAVLKKNVEVAKNLRMIAAELEVETAALYHAELWQGIEDLKTLAAKMEVDDDTETTEAAKKPMSQD